MSVTITLDPMVAGQLQAQASLERLSAEDLAQELLAEAVRQRARSVITEAANRRRVELVRKSNRGTLSGDETAELDRLQTQLDEGLERWDQELLAELGRMVKAVEDPPMETEWDTLTVFAYPRTARSRRTVRICALLPLQAVVA
jgi:hypothetical protein